MIQSPNQSSSASSSSNISDTPPEFYELVRTRTIDDNASTYMFSYQIDCIEKYGQSMFDMLHVHPEYPFAKVFCFPPGPDITFPEELLWFFWYMLHNYHIAIQFPVHHMLKVISQFQSKPTPELCPFMQFLTWFKTLSNWKSVFTHQLSRYRGSKTTVWSVMYFHKHHFIRADNLCYSKQEVTFHRSYSFDLIHNAFDHPVEVRSIERTLFEKNQMIPAEIWPSFHDEAPWELFPPSYSAKLLEARQKCIDDITRHLEATPDTSEIQDYPAWWYPDSQPDTYQEQEIQQARDYYFHKSKRLQTHASSSRQNPAQPTDNSPTFDPELSSKHIPADWIQALGCLDFHDRESWHVTNLSDD